MKPKHFFSVTFIQKHDLKIKLMLFAFIFLCLLIKYDFQFISSLKSFALFIALCIAAVFVVAAVGSSNFYKKLQSILSSLFEKRFFQQIVGIIIFAILFLWVA